MSPYIFVFMLICAYAHGLHVNTTEGVVEGYNATDGNYYVFHGIPYAGPTDGNNRFKAPVPPTSYSGIFHANKSDIVCAQPSPTGLVGVENCLTLNIFTKNTTASMPVIVWLNAEDYSNTSTRSYSPKTFVEENVVFVPLNFRVSVFGFLCLGVEEAPGNAGLRDVLQGLKWISSNIARFGGDPNNVVLMGHASGAAIVDLITMAPQAKDLVHKAVGFSGSALAPWAVAYDPIGNAMLLGEKLGYSAKYYKDLINHLVSANSSVLNTALLQLSDFELDTPAFAPCIENIYLNPQDTVLSDAPLRLIRSGKYLQIPYITAYTTEEGSMRASQAISKNWLKGMNNTFIEFLPANLKYNVTIDLVNEVKEFYFGSKQVNASTIDDYLDYQGDTLVVIPAIQGVKERSQNTTAEIRLLEFGYLGTTESDLINNQTQLKGVPHGGILNYLFDYSLKASDKPVMTSIIKRFVGFAYTGTPNIINSTVDIAWSPVTKGNITALRYESQSGVKKTANYTEAIMLNPHNDSMIFWERVYKEHYLYPADVLFAHGLQVNTSEGIVEGYTASDGNYYVFYGIPYAGPTDGKNRFKAPVPPAAYSGIFRAGNSDIVCAQPSPNGLVGVENCLTLNIFSKNTTASMPVIVWLNAEDYSNTSTHLYSPKTFVEENVVFVSLNFRLSVFGFLCLGVEEAPGNAGLRDVLQGLKWINSNIANFGGDAKNVILMGHASGAAIVDLITMAPQAQGLVHKAVALSGSALAPWAIAYDPTGYAMLLGAKLGYSPKSNKDLASDLVNCDSSMINLALLEMLDFANNTLAFAPCVENIKLNPNNTVLSDAPLRLITSGKYLQIPLIMGYTTEEGTMRETQAVSKNWLTGMNKNFADYLPADLNRHTTKDVANDVKKFYFGSNQVNVSTIDKYLDYEGDTLVVVPVIQGAKERSQNSTAEVRLFEFGYVGTTESNIINNQTQIKGVPHGRILNYLFDYNLKTSDKSVMTSLVKRFVGFAYTGTPNITNSTMNISWSPITKDNVTALRYASQSSVNQTASYTETVIANPHKKSMVFWEVIIKEQYVIPRSVEVIIVKESTNDTTNVSNITVVNGLQVNTTEGIVVGNKATDGDYYVFYGIPYAGPTEGKNRFKAPVPPPAHSGVLYANNSGIVCAQPSPKGLVGVENCLTLNIFTKNITTPKPVIVWLNAEDYSNTSTHPYSPKTFVEENIVFVSLNFRLSIFGFLCLGVEEAPGNAGLRDVLQGLRWINSNIARFGGDPNNVILMGHASGAAIVDLITMAPQAKGLVHKAVALSGSALASWAVAYDPTGYAMLLGTKFGYVAKSNKDLAYHLIGTPGFILNSALLHLLDFENNTVPFAPCIENIKLNPNDTVLSEPPLRLISSGKYLQIPYITGYTTEEGSVRINQAVSKNWLSGMNENFTDYLPADLKYNVTNDLVNEIKKFYFGSKAVNESTIDKYIDYQGDTLVVVPVIQGAIERSINSTGEVRLLEFGYLGAESNPKNNQTQLKGVPHGGILKYLFDYDLKPSDKPVMTSLVNRFVGFAYTGKPYVTNSTMDIPWKPVTKDSINALQYIANETTNYMETIIYDPHNESMIFWEHVLNGHYEYPPSVDLSSNIIGSMFVLLMCQLMISLF